MKNMFYVTGIHIKTQKTSALVEISYFMLYNRIKNHNEVIG